MLVLNATEIMTYINFQFITFSNQNMKLTNPVTFPFEKLLNCIIPVQYSVINLLSYHYICH